MIIPGGQVRFQKGRHAIGAGQGQVLGVMARQTDLGAAQGQDPGGLQAQRAVPHHQEALIRGKVDGFRDPQGRGQGFGEDRGHVRDLRGHQVQVGRGQGQVGGEGAVMVFEPQNPTLPAVAGQALPAEVAGAAADIDLSHHPLAQPGGVVGSGHHPDEFVAHDAAEAVVTFEDLPVGAADPGQRHPD